MKAKSFSWNIFLQIFYTFQSIISSHSWNISDVHGSLSLTWVKLNRESNIILYVHKIYATAKNSPWSDSSCTWFVNFIVTTVRLQKHCNNLQCKMLLRVNSTYFYLTNCGSKMVHYCNNTNCRNSGAKTSRDLFQLPLWACCCQQTPGIIYFIQPNKLHCKIKYWIPKHFLALYTTCSKYFSQLSLKITHNNNHNNN